VTRTACSACWPASPARRKGEEPIKEHLLLTRYNPERVSKGEMLGVEDVKEILAVTLLGVIPESQAVLKASNQGVPVILDDQSDAGQAYSDAVDRLLGKTVNIASSMLRRRDSSSACLEATKQ
jgi:septum site-determining protein MinD